MKMALCATLGLLLLSIGCSDDKVTNPAPPSLRQVLDKYYSENSFPGLAFGYLNGAAQVEVVGTRKTGTINPIQNSDLFHLGSNCKAMSSTMIATLVAVDSIQWNTTIGDVFPEFGDSIPDRFMSVTLRQLLCHRSGVLPLEELEDLQAVPQFAGSLIQQRYEFSEWALENSDTALIDSFSYSNGGYVVAAAMVEKITGMPWEELMVSRLLTPLGISAVFDWPAEEGRDQPWGHTWQDGVFLPYNPDSSLQFPPLLNPAGNISMTLQDYMKFLDMHLRGFAGDSGLLPDSVFSALHNVTSGYVMGWMQGVHPLTGVPVWFHEGSDGTFDAFVVVKPTQGKASIVVTNCSSPSSADAITNACVEIVETVR